jgi:O-antigen ligase
MKIQSEVLEYEGTHRGRAQEFSVSLPLLRYLGYVMVLLIPLRNIVEKVPNLGVDGLNVTNLTFGAAIALVILDYIYSRETRFNGRLFCLIVLYTAYNLISIFWTDANINNYSNMLKFWKDIALGMSLFLISAQAFRSKDSVWVVLLLMAAANIYMDLYFWRWVRWTDFSAFAVKMKDVNGTFGSMGGSNEWAAFFSTYSFVWLAIADYNKKKLIKLFFYLLTFLNILVMLFSFSRGSYFSFVAGLSIYSIITKKYRWLLILIAIIAFYSLVLPDSVVERVNMSFAQEDGGQFADQDIVSRFEMWNYSIEKIMDSLLIGNGFMSFAYLEWRNPHNQHLNILYQGGVIGYLLFLALFWKSFVIAFTAMKSAENPIEKSISAGMSSGVVSLFCVNFFGDRWSCLPLIGYFWILLGVINCFQNTSEGLGLRSEATG